MSASQRVCVAEFPSFTVRLSFVAPVHSSRINSTISCRQTNRSSVILVENKSSVPNADQDPPLSSKTNSRDVLNFPFTVWKRTLHPLGDFGFGRKSIWEGGVGLFLVSGAIVFILSLLWLKGFYLRSRFRKYQAVFEFSQACGICTGTPVRIRGVNVGTIIRIIPSLRSIEAVAEVEDDKIIIPRNSLIEVNQSGLLMEPIIDITPQDPLPTASVSPLDPSCVKDGLIVCNRQKIAGQTGVSLDALVGVFTRLGREMEKIGVSRSYALAESVASVVRDARPLLEKIEAMAADFQPLLLDLRKSNLLQEFEILTQRLSETTQDIREVHSALLTPANTELIRQSVFTLLFTLKNIERISSDILGFTGDEATMRNLKLLIKSLSRLL